MYKEIINNTLRSVFENANTLVRVLSLYTLIIIAIDYINAENLVIIDGKLHVDNWSIFILTFSLSYIVLLMVAISTHRVLILGEESIPYWGLFKLSKREWSFFKGGVLIGVILLLTMIPLIIFAALGKAWVLLGLLFFFIAMFIVISRLSLIFPAIAIDKEISLSDAWNFTKNYKMLVFY